MIKYNVEFEGFSEFEEQLVQFANIERADLVVRNTLVKATKVAMQPTLSTAYSLAKLGPPNPDNIHMKETLRIDGRIPTEKDKLSEYVKETDVAIAIVSVKKSAVSLAQEFGTANVSAKPFIRQAFDGNVETVTNIMKNKLAETLPAQLIKLKKYQGYK
mgnify:CR=1 FL=1